MQYNVTTFFVACQAAKEIFLPADIINHLNLKIVVDFAHDEGIEIVVSCDGGLFASNYSIYKMSVCPIRPDYLVVFLHIDYINRK